MTELRLTQEQADAIARRSGSLFLHAGAGSGKTRVLVERFVRAVLDDGVAVERVLAITFTEKAAAELKGRLRRRFLELGERERAREAESAWVSTIHGFCSRVLRANALLAGIDPEYRVLDEADAARLSIDAFDRALEEFVLRASSGGAERLDLVASYTPDKLQRMVTTVYSRLRSRGQRAPRLEPIEPPVVGDERAALEAALAAASARLGGLESPNKTVLAALSQLEGCSKLLSALPADALGDAADFERTRVKRGNATALRDDAFDSLDRALDAWVAVCGGQKAYADYVLLAKLLELYHRRYAGLKDAASALDFDDLELRARDLLAGEAPLREAVRSRFEHVMVDEFQDTNPLQNELLDLVSRDNLFTVGDERQSIYGFRNADVGVFRSRRDAARAAGRDARLAVNFRSRPELIAALNGAFADVFGEEFVPLSAPDEGGSAAPTSPAPAPLLELLVVNNKRKCWESLGEHPFGDFGNKVPVWRTAEARLLASRVERLVSGGSFGYGDVAVLLRAASDMGVYERALNDRGVPTYATGAGGYWGQQQVADLRSYLSALANPRDDLSLYNVLASPLCGASLDALPLVRRGARAAGRDLWWALEEAFVAGGDGSEGLESTLPPGDRAAVGEFVRRFAAERRAAPRMSLESLIDRAVTASGYDRAVLALPGGGRRMANVRKLMRLAREYEAEAGRDLRGFIDFVDERESLAAREGEAPLEGEGIDAVRLMTVHAAKGLEFPVVCVADLGRTGRGDDGALQVSADGRVGLEVASLGGGSSHSAMSMKEIKAEQEALAEEEERRIFYVAMTRARERLIVSGATDTVDWPAAKPLGAPLDWVWPALAPGAKLLFEGAPDGVVEREGVPVHCVLLAPETVDDVLPGADRQARAAAKSPASASTAGAPDPTPSPASSTTAPGAPPEFAPLAEGVPLPVARLSYSSLESYKRCGYRFYLERVVKMPRLADPLTAPAPAADEGPPADLDQLELTAAPIGPEALSPLVRGTIVHELLERIDFRRPRAASRAEIGRQGDANRVALTEDDVSDIEGLLDRFLQSEICARIRSARRVRQELPFAYGLDRVLINGVVDVHVEEAERLLVVDYKTDALDGRDPVAVCDEKYSGQRLVYALAGLRANAGEVEVAYCFLERPDLVVSRRFTQADRGRLEAELLDLAGGVIAGRFEPTAEPHRELCQFCPGRPALCSWTPDRTLAERPEGETFAAPEPERQLS